MMREEPCLNKHIPCAPCSKDDKDKSNSTTLMEMHDLKYSDDSSERGSRCSSEKDSGYSDGSDCQQTDAEDQRGNKSRTAEGADASGKSKDHQQGSTGNTTLMPAGLELPPINIRKSMVLKQSNHIQRKGQQLGKNENNWNGGAGTTHIIVFQQPSSVPSSLQVHKSLAPKTNIIGKQITSTYLPILNSYPRIAPHPSKKPSDKTLLNTECLNLSKRICTEQKSDILVPKNQLHQHFYNTPQAAISTSVEPCILASINSSSTSQAAASSSQTCLSLSSSCTTSSSFANRRFHRNGNSSSRNRRFLNTAEILRQSGLLDITLRTKELLRQSNDTEQDIAQLRKHTELFFQAACNQSSCRNSVKAWEYLHTAMAESGSYPDLHILPGLHLPCHPDPANNRESINTADSIWPQGAMNPGLQQSHPAIILEQIQKCPGSQQFHTEQHRELAVDEKPPEKVTFTLPDSSTDWHAM